MSCDSFYVNLDFLQYSIGFHRIVWCASDESVYDIFQEIQLSRLSDCAVTIFAMASSLARASRAFSEGYEHSYFDVDLAKTVVAANETKMDSDFDLLKANK